MNDVAELGSGPEVHHGPLSDLGGRLRAHAVRRVFVVTTPSRRNLDALQQTLAGLEVEVFDEARVHVPAPTVEAAQRAATAFAPDAIVALGGGAATGLGKALRMRVDARLVAVPTTYSGSEATRIWGITDGAKKTTGRDPKARPDLVLYDPSLVASLPRATAMCSLLNAAAHPISALSANDEADVGRAARSALASIVRAMWEVAGRSERDASRSRALAAVHAAGRVLDTAKMGAQHRVAHALGGRFDLPHAPLHAILLGPFLHALPSTPRDAIAEAFAHDDPSGLVHDMLRRAGAVTSLASFALRWTDLREALDDAGLTEHAPWVFAAFAGRRMSTRARYLPLVADAPPVTIFGPALGQGRRTILTVPAAGQTADDATEAVRMIVGDDPQVTIAAAQPGSDGASSADATAALSAIAAALRDAGGGPTALYGAREAADVVLRWAFATDHPLDGLVAVAGAGEPISGEPDAGDWGPRGRGLQSAPALLTWSEDDEPAALDRIATRLTEAGAQVDSFIVPGPSPDVGVRQRRAARARLLGRPDPAPAAGFGNVHASETLPGALPTHQNSPRRPPYGLYAEQINGTGFVAPRASNRRTWLYRVRPSANRPPFSAFEAGHVSADFVGTPPQIDLLAHSPLPAPSVPVDFVEGLHTYGGAGDPTLRRGWALHLYAASRSMEHRAMYDADGELLLLPEHGALTLVTEMGALDVHPGEVAIIPRGVAFSVVLHEGFARGYVAEVFGRHFELPERGPVGANGLADPRHFRAPTAWHEDRLAPGYSIVAKLGGRLYETQQDYSPFDVVAWHGNLTPYVYDLLDFLPVATVRRDHVDPSVYTVLSAPMDEVGSHCLDLVVFPPRWDPTEKTFRPPFFHRNATFELNGIIREAHGDEMFHAGMCFATPPMTPHGVRADAVERTLAEDDHTADAPRRMWADALWFQFESALPISLSRWALESDLRIADWPNAWGQYRVHFDPTRHDPFEV